MSKYSKIYSRAFHPEETLILTWEPGYKNVCIYDNDRLVHEWETPNRFMKGVKIEDPHLGEIQLKFTDTRPLQLELRVKNKKYKPNKDGKQAVDLTGISAVFYVLAAFTFLAFAIALFTAMNHHYPPDLVFGAIFLIVITVLYSATAVLISKKHHWAFFMGTGYLILSTLYNAWVVSMTYNNFSLMLLVFIKSLFLLYLFLSIRKVLFAMRNNAIDEAPKDLLDEKF